MPPARDFNQLVLTIGAMHNFEDEDKIRGIKCFIENSIPIVKNVQDTAIALMTAAQRRDHPMQPVINRPNSTFQTNQSLWKQFPAGAVRNVFQAVNKQPLLEDMLTDLRARNLSRLKESATRMMITLLVEGGAPR
ncbi:hypothetical protein LTR98_011437 [Exophiala xenobiotica]|nr:hypothetical protein LTR14_011971 [Exophiala xenobiotica]KAK5332444.1 hypothetical protein LTR98_011437 [Exophiala xenobiotica]KAK5466287.1 hypothetical protein LTR55_011604 [Exophiala xenobiotica]